jgi:hypothetical protein
MLELHVPAENRWPKSNLLKANVILQSRHLAVVGKTGHVATFDWQTGTLHAELHLQETCRDITYVHLCLRHSLDI